MFDVCHKSGTETRKKLNTPRWEFHLCALLVSNFKSCIFMTWDNIQTISNIWIHRTSLTPPLSIEVPVPCQESEWSCICVLEVSVVPLSTIFNRSLVQCALPPILLRYLLSIYSDSLNIGFWRMDGLKHGNYNSFLSHILPNCHSKAFLLCYKSIWGGY